MNALVPPAVCVDDFEVLARQAMDDRAFDYCAGGAGSEATLRWNVAAFEDWTIVPRAFAGSVPDLGIMLAAGPCAVPIGISPVSLQRMVHSDAELGLAVAAERRQSPLALSMFASESLESVAAAAPTTVKLQQLYLLPEPAITRSVLGRAAAAGFMGVLVTCDTPVQGDRRRDRRRELRRFDADRPALCDDPVFADILQRRQIHASQLINDLFPHVSASWDDLAQLVASTRLPVYVKGVVHPDDVDHALHAGAAGIVVSNHGGRQLDHAPSTVSALSAIADRCAGRLELLFDSGVRSGADAFIALALGATAVFVGRPAIWGLAADGAAGVESVLGLLLDDLARTMSMAGASSVSSLDPGMVRRR